MKKKKNNVLWQKNLPRCQIRKIKESTQKEFYENDETFEDVKK